MVETGGPYSHYPHLPTRRPRSRGSQLHPNVGTGEGLAGTQGVSMLGLEAKPQSFHLSAMGTSPSESNAGTRGRAEPTEVK